MSSVRRIYVEKKPGFDVEAKHLYSDLKVVVGIKGLTGVRVLHRYDISGVSDEVYQQSRTTIFSEPPIDYAFDETFPLAQEELVFAMEYLPGQYDQRADSAAQCVQILTQQERPEILTAKIIVLKGEITIEEFSRVKTYCINPVDSREASLNKPDSLDLQVEIPQEVAILEGFLAMNDKALQEFMEVQGLAMNFADLKFCQEYFKDTEKRNPTITEIKVIDTYWSDHCRHTTFFTNIERVEIEEGLYSHPIKEAYQQYLDTREFVYENKDKAICLMDIATIAMKELRKKGLLEDLEVSEEINACSIVVNAQVNGKQEEWLVMFKNETHNHPTEIEPFGGAATCLGGAIRDPLSGRSYVYQAMRVTGSADPRANVEDTIAGKLPQRKITTGAAAGYSSYGNQIGLATGQVTEIYHEGYLAKRMEIGAVIAAAPKENVIRETPLEGDKIILLGGRTGRDGCGGATGSSKEHTEESIFTCGAEVQKGNPPTERKIQRLFRNSEVSKLIKKCNDFGAGGVSVAIGELAEGLNINLDVIPKKYEGLDGTELAISESQERMAVVVAPENVSKFIEFAAAENLEATEVAEVTAHNRLKMFWNKQAIVDIDRDFLNTNGIRQNTHVSVTTPAASESFFDKLLPEVEDKLEDITAAWFANLANLNVASQKGLGERFDSTIGAGTVIMPYGGKYQQTPAQSMVAKLPVLEGETDTATIMTFGFNPLLAQWSPFHGALYAVVDAVAKIVASGGSYHYVRLTLQEYFEKLGTDKKRWGKPFSALLGAFFAQKQLAIPAIGGKDSMSGTFKDLDVPPTLVAFAVGVTDVNSVISPEFKQAGSKVLVIPVKRNEKAIPDFNVLKANFSKITDIINAGIVLSAHTVGFGGIAEAVTKMTFGNKIGLVITTDMPAKQLFAPEYGAVVLEVKVDTNLESAFGDTEYIELGYTQEKANIVVGNAQIDIEEAYQQWSIPLEKIFPVKADSETAIPDFNEYNRRNLVRPLQKITKPRVFLPVFPGTNCEYDTAKAFENVGAIVNTFIFRNLSADEIEHSIEHMVNNIQQAQIIMFPGGFSAGDEPDGSGKFIATIFRNPRVNEAVMKFLKEKDGLMLGICNGFQALIKLGLVPFGEIRDYTEDSPTLTYNTIGRHISCMVETKVVSTLSPWLNNVNTGDVHSVAISHGEGRFVASEETIQHLMSKGQIATQYHSLNPNGSGAGIEGITSPDGRVFGKMGHSERIGSNLYKNVPGEKDQKIFQAGVAYFRD